ncbi:MAG: SAM-dependent methyltransferase [Anaerolineae bacterium]|nr:SAM-dependent methyltransferase [Anaerolineae bacterium]
MDDQSSRIPASFRDPSGFVFQRDGRIYRQINSQYREPFDHLIASGLCDKLIQDNLLIPHTDVGREYALTEDAYTVIQPETLPFVSYPYEWCFSQLKDAALLTLEIQLRAIDAGMSLKDSSAYNIQFVAGKPLLIDTLSFEMYEEGRPWIAYRQFCQHFLAPLALMSYRDIRLHQLLRVYIDGIPLDLASKLLPVRTRFDLGLLSHIHLHAKAQTRFADRNVSAESRKVSRLSFLGLLDSLKQTVQRLSWEPEGTEWHNYYNITNYSESAFRRKEQLVEEMMASLDPTPALVWDLGANTGVFSQIAARQGATTIAFDIDPAAVEKNYRETRARSEAHILPLVLDLTNPSPGVGWEHRERASLMERGPATVALALALVHHLAISNNLPFHKIANFFHRICHTLIIEFVPKNDSQVQKLLASREDIFGNYDQTTFEYEFRNFFDIERQEPIQDTERTLYKMVRKDV